MQPEGVLLLSQTDVDQLLSLEQCIAAVEKVFRLQGEGKVTVPGILGLKGQAGTLHVKTALLPGKTSYFVAKLNTNFPENLVRFGLPTIQGVIVLYDAETGSPLALLDSIDITIKRTAAASAVAAKYLARTDSSVTTVCGCGRQGHAQLRALRTVLPLTKAYAFDLSTRAAQQLASKLAEELDLEIKPVRDLSRAIAESDVCVTCTTSRQFIVRKQDVSPGTFIAAVGADDEHKQEIDPALLASAKVVADSREQCSRIGDTHHAIVQRLMHPESIYAELSEIVAGGKPGRINEDEIIIFDSTGVAIEDAVTAAAIYEKARNAKKGGYFNFAA
jgi:alanine dehydrogenase